MQCIRRGACHVQAGDDTLVSQAETGLDGLPRLVGRHGDIVCFDDPGIDGFMLLLK